MMSSNGSSQCPVRTLRRAGFLQPLAAALVIGFAAASCGSGSEECSSLPDSCIPALSTDYNTIYRNVFGARCGTGNGVMTCHGSTGNQGGLTLADPDGAYNSLLGAGGHARVIPGDPACSPLMARLTSGDPNVRMPKGEAPLAEGVICAVQSWIHEGAAR
jgi:hypothetical protein